MKTKAELQAMFDTVATHLLRQGKRSEGRMSRINSRTDICLYRGPEGRKCAAGILIPDSKYRPEFEGWNIVGEAGESVNLKKAIGIEGDAVALQLVNCLQTCHDVYEPNEWWSKLTEVAEKFRLDTRVLVAEARR